MKRFQQSLTAALLILLMLSAWRPAAADDSRWEISGDAGAELRWFPHEPRFEGQSEDLFNVSLILNGEARWRSEDGQRRAGIRPFLRLDSVDSERTHFDLREAWFAWEGEGWEVLAGFNKVFWGVTESRHLVDVINQSDAVEDPDLEQKLGQPMVRTLMQRDWGQLEFYLMPWFRERTYPARKGRLRAPYPVDTGKAEYESGAGQNHLDLAMRWSHYIGDVDIGLHVFHGTARAPLLLPGESGKNLVPFYYQSSQIGVDLQYTRDAWLWKFEGFTRKGWKDDYLATVGGLEYTFYGVRQSSFDVGVLVEYLYDGRAGSEPATIFDNDVFLGSRIAWNDAADTSLLAGIVVDRNDSEWFLNVEAERRLGNDWSGEVKLRVFKGDRRVNGLYAFDRDDYLQISLQRFF